VTRIVSGVGDLVWRTGDGQGQVGYSVARQSRGQVTLYARISWFGLKTKVDGFSQFGLKIDSFRFPGLGLKTNSYYLVILASKSS
jgi:hypothetical protein